MTDLSKKLLVGLLYDDTLDSSDGVAHQVKELGSWLSIQGHHVFYMCGETNTDTWAGGKIYSLAKNIKVSFNNNRLSIPLASRSRDITKTLNAEKPDIIHVQMPYSPVMAQRVIKRAYKNTAIVSTFHIFPSGLLSIYGSHLLSWFQYFSYNKITIKLSVSSAAQDFALKSYGLKTKVVPNMVNLSKFSSVYKMKENHIVFLGRLVDRKGCKELILAFNEVKKKMPSARLTIGGDGPQRASLERLVSDLGLSDSINFLGYINEKDKPELLGSAHIACFPSLYGESFGIVLVEAMAAGSRVVIGGDNPGYRSVLNPKPEQLVDPKDTPVFAARIISYLNDSQACDQSYKWQKEYVKMFDVNVVGQQILNKYHQAIAKKDLNKA